MTVIVGIKLSDQQKDAVEFQEILSEFNCIIKLRIGIKNSEIFYNSTNIVLLQTEDDEKTIELEKNLLEIPGIELQRMIF